MSLGRANSAFTASPKNPSRLEAVSLELYLSTYVTVEKQALSHIQNFGIYMVTKYQLL